MTRHDIIVLGTSLGGVEALVRLVRGLPAGLPAALYVVCHISSKEKSLLPQILARATALSVSQAEDGEPIHYGHISVAPPDRHLVLTLQGARLTHGPRENRHRPAIDPLFRTAARAFGERVIGVVLTGALSDGTAGLMAIRAAGGIAVVQDPAEAFAPSMPETARLIAGADYVVPLAEMPQLLTRLVQQPSEEDGGPNMIDPLDQMPERIEKNFEQQQSDARRGQLTVYTCPECGGCMWQVDEEKMTRFRCHTGHVYYGDALLAEQSEVLEAALWTAVRVFKEKTILSQQLASLEHQGGNLETARRYEDEAAVSQRYGDLIKEHILQVGNAPPGTASDVEVPEEGTDAGK
jgi:two-component system chemotaxis response regulator CheB